MNVLIVGCGWVGTYIAVRLVGKGYRVWATCRSAEKAVMLEARGMTASIVDFDRQELPVELGQTVFDVVIVSVPITRKDNADIVYQRFARLIGFLSRLSFNQSFFFGSVGIYPKVNSTISETTFADDQLDQQLLSGEQALRVAYPNVNVLRLGGLFGLERVMAKYFVGKVCETGYQTANFVHVEDIYGIVTAMVAAGSQAKTYNVVCPEHPLKKDVIAVSAAKYGYGMPTVFSDVDRTAKVVSPERLIADLGYTFTFPSPLGF